MKILKPLILVLVLVFSLAGPLYATLVGKVDVQKILITVKEGKSVRAKLKKEFDKKQKTLKKEEGRIRKMQEDFKKQSLVMNDSAKIKKQQSIQAEIIKLQQKSMGFQKEIQGLESKLKGPILKKVRGIIQTVSKGAGVDMTFEMSAAPIVYAKDQVDLTDKVIKAYDKKFK